MKSPHPGLPELALMRQGVSYRFNIRIREYSLAVRPLSTMETIHAAKRAAAKFQALTQEEQTSVTESIIIVSEKLKIASTSDVGAQDEKLTDLLVSQMSPHELDYLWKQYIAGLERVNPSIEEISAEDLEALVEEVKKSPLGLRSALTELSLRQLVAISHRSLQTSPS